MGNILGKKKKDIRTELFTDEALRELVMNLRPLKPLAHLIKCCKCYESFIHQKSISVNIDPINALLSVPSWISLGHSWSVFNSDRKQSHASISELQKSRDFGLWENQGFLKIT